MEVLVGDLGVALDHDRLGAAGPLAKLQQIELWIEHSHPQLKAMRYHPRRRWLVDHGHDPRLARKVHITEYFAEGTEFYFYRNDFYPFVRAELKRHDPLLCDLLEKVWGDK